MFVSCSLVVIETIESRDLSGVVDSLVADEAPQLTHGLTSVPRSISSRMGFIISGIGLMTVRLASSASIIRFPWS